MALVHLRTAADGGARRRRHRHRRGGRHAADLRASRGVSLVHLGVEPPAPKGEAILVHEDSSIRTLADLGGRKLAFNKGSNVHWLVVRALAKAGMTPKDVTPVYLAAGRTRGLRAGERRRLGDLDPYLAAAQAALHPRVLADGTGGLADNRQFYLSNRQFSNPQERGLKACRRAKGSVLRALRASRQRPWLFAP